MITLRYIMLVPAAMQPAVMLVKLSTRAAIVVTVAIIIISVAADAEPKGNCFGTFLNKYSARLPLCHERNNRRGDELRNRVGK